jgi:hypothetical protein
MGWATNTLKSDYSMIVGDFNADGSYFDENKDWQDIMAKMPGYSLLTDNSLDSSVGASSRSYDRMIASANFPADKPEVFTIEKQIDLSAVFKQGCEDGYVPEKVCDQGSKANKAVIASELSDHYPVALRIKPPA